MGFRVEERIPRVASSLAHAAFGVGAPNAHTKQMSRCRRLREARSRTSPVAADRQRFRLSSREGK